jgi:hypothetical protein
MMDEAIKTHKETTFGWVRMVQDLLVAARARKARRRAARAALATVTPPPRTMRYLAPR